MDASSAEITNLLKAWSGGDPAALERLAEQVYPELRRMARRYMKNERLGNTLQATALVHEVYLRLVDVTKIEWRAPPLPGCGARPCFAKTRRHGAQTGHR